MGKEGGEEFPTKWIPGFFNDEIGGKASPPLSFGTTLSNNSSISFQEENNKKSFILA